MHAYLLHYSHCTQSWEPLQGTSSLFAHLGNNTADGSATLADSQLVTTVDEPHVVEFIIDNLDDGDHPFHLHGHKVRSPCPAAGPLAESICFPTFPSDIGALARRSVTVLDRWQRRGSVPAPGSG
ncbi:hypothetical protein NUW54_g13979 [Trametes sanguinea]|uniref:Uncharacterized protein n=1 Tax=Trametes sanguinea TaxID=158606 RepID=A0ACC1MHV7_9APHY|nr:hypothetical protein NUW54_g13979 [Trametes sanguinea]